MIIHSCNQSFPPFLSCKPRGFLRLSSLWYFLPWEEEGGSLLGWPVSPPLRPPVPPAPPLPFLGGSNGTTSNTKAMASLAVQANGAQAVGAAGEEETVAALFAEGQNAINVKRYVLLVVHNEDYGAVAPCCPVYASWPSTALAGVSLTNDIIKRIRLTLRTVAHCAPLVDSYARQQLTYEQTHPRQVIQPLR